MEIINLQFYLQHHFSEEEFAEEFGVQKTMAERDIAASVALNKNVKKGVDTDEKTKKIRTKSKNSSR